MRSAPTLLAAFLAVSAFAADPAPPTAPATPPPLSPADGLKALHVPADLEVQQLLAEPVVRQPVFLNFDERGRMWVVQYLQYPYPAGLKAVSHDVFWRAIYDKPPLPPPHQYPAHDKISIFEDTNGDGVFRKEKTFVDGLSIATAVERGRGGVWVMNTPFLLFYPDRNNDDVPDGDPEVCLTGFGFEDTHSVANSLRWGPDGWLYGAQGSTVTSRVTAPGNPHQPAVDMVGQGIWRYHPESHRFEVFAEGGGNTFGLELDAKGRIFSGYNGADTHGFHYVQGAYLKKGFEKHGQLSNPYAYGYFPEMPHQKMARFTHNFIIYEGGALPAEYWGKLFGAQPIKRLVTLSDFEPEKSTFRTKELDAALTSDDPWFRPVDIKVGPDGAIYLCDWYDDQLAHYKAADGAFNADTGRIYRLQGKGAQPAQPFDLGRLSSAELVGVLSHPNRWFRQTAQRLLTDRHDATILPQLLALLKGEPGQLSLEALWALNASGGLDQPTALRLLEHRDPFVRLWTVRLMGDAKKVTPEFTAAAARLAEREENVEVRVQLACTAKRLPAEQDLSIVRAMLRRDADADDPRLPLLLWWAIESKAASDRDAVLALFSESPLWDTALLKQHLLERIMRRYAQAGTRQDLLTCAKLLDLAPTNEHAKILAAGFEAAFKGRAVSGLPQELVDALTKRHVASLALRLRQGEPGALAEGLRLADDPKGAKDARVEVLSILGDIKAPESVPVLLHALDTATEPALQKAALASLQAFDLPEIGAKTIARLSQLEGESRSAALVLLTSREAWAGQLVEAVKAGKVDAALVPREVAQRLAQHHDVAQLWPNLGLHPTTAQMTEKIAKLNQTLAAGPADPYHGHALYSGLCGACHTLFGEGGKIGPDLTPHPRTVDSLLLNIVNPSAEIREGYENFTIETKDGRTLAGFLAEKDQNVVVLRALDGQNVTLERSAIAKMETSGVSLMPEGLLDAMSEQDVRDLFAYLRSTQPLPPRPKGR